MKKLKESKSKNTSLIKELKVIISKWKKIVNQDEPKKKPKSPLKKEEEFPKEILLADASYRNNTRKKLYTNLITCIDNEEEKKELINKVLAIENVIYNKLKGDSPYTNRVLEILHNLKTNEDFKKKVVNGELSPEQLATMDVIEMLDKNKKKEINEAKENKVNSVRSDWEETHSKVTSGVYKCKKCGGDKTKQHEMQTRSADEPMTIFITCTECGNSWRI